jgi:hypothetical protein
MIYIIFLLGITNCSENANEVSKFAKNNSVSESNIVVDKKKDFLEFIYQISSFTKCTDREGKVWTRDEFIKAVKAKKFVIDKKDLNIERQVAGLTFTPLYYALAADDYEIAQLLIDNGANINYKNNRGQPLLFYLLKAYRLKDVSFLLEQGADTEARDSNNRNLLAFAKDMKAEIETRLYQGNLEKKTVLFISKLENKDNTELTIDTKSTVKNIEEDSTQLQSENTKEEANDPIEMPLNKKQRDKLKSKLKSNEKTLKELEKQLNTVTREENRRMLEDKIQEIKENISGHKNKLEANSSN